MLTAIPIAIALLLQIPQPSQPPVPTPSKGSHNQEGHRTGVDGGPKDSEAPSTMRSATVSAQSTNNGDQKSSSEWWMLVFTAVIAVAAVVQAVIYGKQSGLMRRSLAETKKAADAATKSAQTAEDALHISERADVLIHEAKGSDGHLMTPETEISVTLQNCGRSKAVNVNLRCYIAPIAHNRGFPVSTDSLPGVRYGPPVVLAPSGQLVFPFGPLGNLIDTPSVIDEINEGTYRLWLKVVVDYTDIFKTPHLVVGSGIFSRRHSLFLITTDTSE